jgi:hypothetical protein
MPRLNRTLAMARALYLLTTAPTPYGSRFNVARKPERVHECSRVGGTLTSAHG